MRHDLQTPVARFELGHKIREVLCAVSMEEQLSLELRHKVGAIAQPVDFIDKSVPLSPELLQHRWRDAGS